VRSSYGLVLFTLLEERFSAGLTLSPARKAAFLFRRWVVRALEVEGFGFGPGADVCLVNGERSVEEGGAPPASPCGVRLSRAGAALRKDALRGMEGGRGCHHRKGGNGYWVNHHRADSGLLVGNPTFVHELVEGLVGIDKYSTRACKRGVKTREPLVLVTGS
jgi:hypothetical protein